MCERFKIGQRKRRLRCAESNKDKVRVNFKITTFICYIWK